MSNQAQRSFAKGEISPALYARTDEVAYATGLRTCRNLRVLKQGGVENRPGTVLVGQTPGGNPVRLLPFIFSDSQTYVLEFSNLALRFIRAGAYLQSAGIYTVVTPYTTSELPDLQIAQSADVVTIVHPNHPPMALTRLAETNWTLAALTFAPSIAAPTGLTKNPSGGPGTFIQWVVTAVDAETGQESFPSDVVGVSSVQKLEFWKPMLTWDAVPGAKWYNVYKGGSSDGSIASDLGFIGSTGTTSFQDTGQIPDMLNRAPVPRNPFSGPGEYPGVTGYFQGRRTFAASTNHPERIWTSRSADFNNFTESTPSQDDDALTLDVVGRRVNTIKHLLDHVNLFAFASGAEFVINGDSGGVLRPSDIGALNFSEHGCSRLTPLRLDSRILYVQARQAIVRDVIKDPYTGYRGNDLSIMSGHLFTQQYQLVDWAYQENPGSIIWCVRSDGALLGLTDVAEQAILGWHRHDTLGSFENVCVIPEGAEDAVYVCVNRNGSRYVERFASRAYTDIRDAVFLDASLSYDGRNTNDALTVTLSGGTTWNYDELLTLTASASLFSLANVGDAWFLLDPDDDSVLLRFQVTAYTSATVVQGFADRLVPVDLRSATASWARAVRTVSGVAHLEGLNVGVFADGDVIGSPNNPDYPVFTVSGGSVVLDRCYARIRVGLPYVADFETLDLDTSQGPSIKPRRSLINELTLLVAETRGVFAGNNAPPSDNSTDGLVEWKLRNHEDYGEPVRLRTGTITEKIPGHWSLTGRVFVRQVDPLPITILAAIPSGAIAPPS